MDLIETWQVQRYIVQCTSINNLGDTTLKKHLLGPRGQNLRKLEDELRRHQGTEDDPVRLEGIVSQGRLELWCKDWALEELQPQIMSNIHSLKKQFIEETELLRPSPDFSMGQVLGAGGLTSDVCLPGEFVEICVKQPYHEHTLEHVTKKYLKPTRYIFLNDVRAIFTFDTAGKAAAAYELLIQIADGLNITEKQVQKRTRKGGEDMVDRMRPNLTIALEFERRQLGPLGFIEFESEIEAMRYVNFGLLNN